MPGRRPPGYTVLVCSLLVVSTPSAFAEEGGQEDGLPPIRIAKRTVASNKDKETTDLRKMAEHLFSEDKEVRRAAVEELKALHEKKVAALTKAMKARAEEAWARRGMEAIDTVVRKAAWKALTRAEKNVVRQRLRSAVIKGRKEATERDYPYKNYVLCDIGDIRIAYLDHEPFGEGSTGTTALGLPIDSTSEKESKGSHWGGQTNAAGELITRGFSYHYKDGETSCVFYEVPFLIRYGKLYIEDHSVPFGRGKSVIFLNSAGEVDKIVYAPECLNR